MLNITSQLKKSKSKTVIDLGFCYIFIGVVVVVVGFFLLVYSFRKRYLFYGVSNMNYYMKRGIRQRVSGREHNIHLHYFFFYTFCTSKTSKPMTFHLVAIATTKKKHKEITRKTIHPIRWQFDFTFPTIQNRSPFSQRWAFSCNSSYFFCSSNQY